MKYFLAVLLSIIYVVKVNSQSNGSFDLCGADSIHKYLMQHDDEYKQKQIAFEAEVKKAKGQASLRSVNIYRIPVVVHVMHLGEPIGSGTNLSDDEIKQGLYYINERYRKLANTPGYGNGVDVEIEFALAVRDTNSKCTNGIVRYDMSGVAAYVTDGVKYQGTAGFDDSKLKALSRWNPKKYYNIYLVNKIDSKDCSISGAVDGYAYFASAHGTAIDGTMMRACSFSKSTSITLTHELGHSLNLYHTFEGDNNGNSCPSGTGDYCNDTPKHIRYTSNAQFMNQPNNCSYAGANSCDVGTTQSHMHNYMDYSWELCQNEFTADQKLRMVTALTSTRSSFLESNGNLSLVPPLKPTVDFDYTSELICAGSSITFRDKSSCSPNTYINTPWNNITYLWKFDNGVNTPITSTLQNPTIVFNDFGEYSVSLNVTNAEGASSLTKKYCIAVSSAPVAACIPPKGTEGSYKYTISNVKFNKINNTTSVNNNSTYTDYSCTNATIVQENAIYNLSVLINSGSNNAENVRVYIDWNNNGMWEAQEMVLADQVTSFGSKTCSANVNVPANAVKRKNLRMRVYGEAGTLTDPELTCSSKMYIPDVEDYGVYIVPGTKPLAGFSYTLSSSCDVLFADTILTGTMGRLWTFEGGSPSSSSLSNPTISFDSNGDHLVKLVVSNLVGSDSITKTIHVVSCIEPTLVEPLDESNKITIFPNPTDGKIDISFSQPIQDATVKLFNITGQLVFEKTFFYGTRYSIDLMNYLAGIYQLEINTSNHNWKRKLVKQ